MQTVHDTRRQRLATLKKKYGTWADLNIAIGWDKTSARLSQIHSGSIRSDRGTPYVMGDETAREIEKALGLEVGWMDTPMTYAELHGEDDVLTKALCAMESMDASQRYQALRLLDALAQPAAPLKTGAHDHKNQP